MKQEEITRQADKYATSKLIDTSNHSLPTRRKQLDYDNYDLSEAFEAGADWRIKSVWHSANEIPRGHATILEENELNGMLEYNLVELNTYDGWKNRLRFYNVIRWAYLSDLLP